MSVSVHIEAVIPHDSEQLKQMQIIRDACQAGGVSLPDEVHRFFEAFDDGEANERGRLVSLKYGPHKSVIGDVEYGEGAYVDISKLPEGTTHIRVSMS